MIKSALLVFISLILFSLFYSCSDDLYMGDEPEIVYGTDIHDKRRCGSTEHMHELLQDPNYKLQYDQRLQSFDKYHATHLEKANCNSPKTIPVAVHFQNVGNVNRSCIIDLVNRQIDALNADFSGQNSDINKWTNNASNSFPGITNGQACLQFVLANSNHPGGYGLSEGEPAITINQTNGDQVNNWSGYLNIYVQRNTGVLGYAPLGGNGSGDGVVIDAEAFGVGAGCGTVSPSAPYDLGRTLTHEVGHYFLLDHIWGNGCIVDDQVADTPDQSSDYSGCPALSSSSCGSKDLHMNYMDYTNDECMYMFTHGQSTRMENYINSNLSNLLSNAANVISGGGNDNGGQDEEEEQEEETPISCSSPTQSTVQILSNTKVKIDWEDISDVQVYRIRYRKVGTSRWTAKNISASQITLSGLSAGSTYEYQLRVRCLTDGWKPFSAKKRFSLETDNSNNSYTLRLILDDYGSETTWYVLDQSYNEIYQGGPYQDGKSGQVITKTINLTSGCYELELQDAYGDGICCDYGNGKAEILNRDNQVIASLDGRFGTFDYIGFCVDGDGLRITSRNRDAKRVNRGSKK